MKTIFALIMLAMMVPFAGAAFHEFQPGKKFQPGKNMRITTINISWRSKIRFLNACIKRSLRRVPVPFGMEVTMAEVKEALDAQRKSWEGIQSKLDDAEKERAKTGTIMAETKAELERRIAEFAGIVDGFKARVDAVETNTQKSLESFRTPQRVESAGDIFANAPALKEFVKTRAANCAPVEVKSFFRKQLVEGDAMTGNGGALIVPFRVPGVIMPVPNQRLMIRNLLNVTTIGTPSLEYVQFDEMTGESSGDHDGGAAIVPETTTKPETSLKFSKKTAYASVIATWLPASRQILADVAALRAFIDNQLLYSVGLEEERQLLYGDGLNDNLEGITTVAQIYNRGQAGDTAIDCLRRMITQVLLARFPATGFVVNPADWEGIELLKDSQDRYIFANPNSLLPERIWGLPVAVSESMIAGDALCGAFGLGATLYDRESANIRISEHHANFFIENMVAILAEERLMLVNFRPRAFVYGDLPTASS